MKSNLFNRGNWIYHLQANNKHFFDEYVNVVLNNKSSINEFADYSPNSFSFLYQLDAHLDILKLILMHKYQIVSTKLYVDYIIDDKFAQPLYIHYKNKKFIAIKTAFIFKVYNISKILFENNNFNNLFKKFNNVSYDKKLIRELMINAFEHNVSGSVCEIDCNKSLTKYSIRDNLKRTIFTMMIQFSFFHELGHFVLKHKVSDASRNDEIEADFFAIHHMLEMLFDSKHALSRVYSRYSNEEKLSFLSLTIILLLHILETIFIVDSALFDNQVARVDYNSNHPINSIRCNFQYIKDIANKSLAKIYPNNYEQVQILFEEKFQQAYTDIRFIWEDLNLPQVNFKYEERINQEIQNLFKNFKWEKIECTILKP